MYPVETDDYREDGFDYDDELPLNQDMPILKDIQLDNKIVSSHAKNKLVFLKPKIEKQLVVVPLLDQNKEIVYRKLRVNGVIVDLPIVHKIVKMDILTGYEKSEEEFPIADWFNDSVPTSNLSVREARYLRRIDDLGAKLARRMVNNPGKLKIMGFLHRLYSQKVSVADSAKGINGAAVDAAKTTTHKSESKISRSELNDFKDYQERKTQKGLLGLGAKVPLVGVTI